MFSSESGHWYDQDGQPAYTYIAKTGKYKGQERPTTLTQARKLNLVPSVTGIINVAANESINFYKQNQLLLAAMTLPKRSKEDADSYMRRVKEDASQHASEAARIGTLIHADIQRGFQGEDMGEYEASYHAVMRFLHLLFPKEKWISEDTFASPLGYGGAIDLRNEAATIFIDFKTKDDIAPAEDRKAKLGHQLVYDSHALQLSAYAEGCNCRIPQRISIFIDRQNPEYMTHYFWDTTEHERHLGMFMCLLSYWQDTRKYKPVSEVINA